MGSRRYRGDELGSELEKVLSALVQKKKGRRGSKEEGPGAGGGNMDDGQPGDQGTLRRICKLYIHTYYLQRGQLALTLALGTLRRSSSSQGTSLHALAATISVDGPGRLLFAVEVTGFTHLQGFFRGGRLCVHAIGNVQHRGCRAEMT